MYYEIFHMVDNPLADDRHLPKTISEVNKICRFIAKDFVVCQCFKIVEIDSKSHKAIRSRWVECHPDGKIGVYHKEVYYE